MIVGVVGWMEIDAGQKLKFFEKHTVKAPRPVELASFAQVLQRYSRTDARRILMKALAEPEIPRDRYLGLVKEYERRYPGDFDDQKIADKNLVLDVSRVLPRIMNNEVESR